MNTIFPSNHLSHLNSLYVVFLVIFFTGRLSSSVKKSLQSSNFPWQIFRLMAIPLWNILRHFGASWSISTSWKTSRDHVNRGSSSLLSSFLKLGPSLNIFPNSWIFWLSYLRAVYSWKFSLKHRCFQNPELRFNFR